jgi:hypothetical protein
MFAKLPVILAAAVLCLFALGMAGSSRATAQTLPPVFPVGPVSLGYGFPPIYPGAVAPWNAFIGIAAPAINFAAAAGSPQPDSCALYDSWCSYCTAWPASDLCKALPPGKMMSSH